MIKRLALIFLLSIAGLAALTASAQTAGDERIIIRPLFDYPLPPDTMQNVQGRADWMMRNFWNDMDFNSKQTVDQNALNDAFNVYITTMRFASQPESDASIGKLIRNIEKNAPLSLQFAKAAVETLYGTNATVWNDHIVLRFINNLLHNKQVKKDRKLRYERLHNILSNSLVGTVPPEFDYITPEGNKAHYEPNGVITVIEFGDPDCDDCRLAKLKMDTDVTFSSLVEKGKVNVLFIYADPEEGWQDKLTGYPRSWHVGASEEIADIYDIRATPTIYVIDRKGRVAAKHIDVQTAMRIAAEAAGQ